MFFQSNHKENFREKIDDPEKMLIQKARNLHKKDSINKQEMLQIFLDMLQQMIRNPRQCLLQIWLINRVPDLQQK